MFYKNRCSVEKGEPACQETLLQLPQQVAILAIIDIMAMMMMTMVMMTMMMMTMINDNGDVDDHPDSCTILNFVAETLPSVLVLNCHHHHHLHHQYHHHRHLHHYHHHRHLHHHHHCEKQSEGISTSDTSQNCHHSANIWSVSLLGNAMMMMRMTYSIGSWFKWIYPWSLVLLYCNGYRSQSESVVMIIIYDDDDDLYDNVDHYNNNDDDLWGFHFLKSQSIWLRVCLRHPSAVWSVCPQIDSV